MRLLVVLLLLLPACCYSSPLKDETLVPITKEALLQAIQQTPLSSPAHGVLIARAWTSHLLKPAYDQYTLLWQKRPNDPYTNLMRGISAQRYWYSTQVPGSHEIEPGSPKYNNYYHIIRECLAKAVKLAPDNAIANMNYGFFLWQWDNHMTEGLALMKKAINQPSATPSLHLTLAEVYRNPSGNAYSLEQAEKEAHTAMQLDPDAAAPHLLLVELLLQKKQYAPAQQELNIYLTLAPPAIAQSTWVQSYQSRINKGLKKL